MNGKRRESVGQNAAGGSTTVGCLLGGEPAVKDFFTSEMNAGTRGDALRPTVLGTGRLAEHARSARRGLLTTRRASRKIAVQWKLKKQPGV